MNEKTIELARRATAAMRRLGLEMRPGMRATWPDDGRPARRYGSPGETAGWVSDYSGDERIGYSDAGAILDLDDPATLGCLLALVREAWPTSHPPFEAHTYGYRTHWTCIVRDEAYHGATEAEALVVALEAARG